MKVLQLYNGYRLAVHGEEWVVNSTDRLLKQHGVEATLLKAGNLGFDAGVGAKALAALQSIYSVTSARTVAGLLAGNRPDVVHAHNLYPRLSPSVLVACRKARVATVLTAHSYFLTCPVTTHLNAGRICTKCVGGREQHCVIDNCRGNRVESLVYAVRSAIAGRLGLYRDNVSLVVALCEFGRQFLIDAGFAPGRIVVLPNAVPMPPEPTTAGRGGYVAFAGRLAPVKGVDILIEAARRTGIPVRLAGDPSTFAHDRSSLPDNVEFAGLLAGDELQKFYAGARFLVFPSRWFEMCPIVILEAMSHGLAVVASRIGGLGELVEHGVSGLLFEAGNPGALAEAMQRLWDAPQECARLGAAGREAVRQRHDQAGYFDRLIEAYQRAVALGFPVPA